MNTTIKNLLFVALGCAIGYFVCWWMCRQRDCKKECKTETHCKDGKKKCDNQTSTNHMGMWDPNCKPGDGNGYWVPRTTMEAAVNAYSAKIGVPTPATPAYVGALGGRIGLCMLRNLVNTIEQEQPETQYLYFRLGLDPATNKYPMVFLIGGQNEGKLMVATSGSNGFCPNMCTLPAGQ